MARKKIHPTANIARTPSAEIQTSQISLQTDNDFIIIMIDQTSSDSQAHKMLPTNDFTWAVTMDCDNDEKPTKSTSSAPWRESTRKAQEASTLLSTQPSTQGNLRLDAERAPRKETLEELASGPWSDPEDQKRMEVVDGADSSSKARKGQ